MEIYEVVVDSPQPGSAEEVEAAYDAAIREFAGSPPDEAPSEALYWIKSFAGWGLNAHPDADGPVFEDLQDAERLADAIRRALGALTANVGVVPLVKTGEGARQEEGGET